MTRPRFTIERIRALVLIAAVVLAIAIGGFLAAGRWTRSLLKSDLPKRLGVTIESQADGVDYTQSRKGKILFKIHAARAVRMKLGEKMLLHDVKIELYGEDGKRSDTISGSEFEYDPATGIAQAAGAVQITLMRPGEKPAVAKLLPDAIKPGVMKPGDLKAALASAGSSAKPQAGEGDASQSPADSAIAKRLIDSQIHVETSGLQFNQKTGIATTSQPVKFALRQGNGASMGATYDSTRSLLILDRAVELHLEEVAQERGNHSRRGPIAIHARHAEFERTGQTCQMTDALAESANGSAQLTNAILHFRDDGSVVRLDGAGGIDLRTPSGGDVSAPRGWLEFDADNRPRRGLLEGGARLEMRQAGRYYQGVSPSTRLEFNDQGELTHVHMERGVRFESNQQLDVAGTGQAQIHRTWTSQIADVDFAPRQGSSKPVDRVETTRNPMEAKSFHGEGGVVMTSETRIGGKANPLKFAADKVTAELARSNALTSLVGLGNASFEQQTANGERQASTSDQIEVRFQSTPISQRGKPKTDPGGSEISSVQQVGHVVLVQSQAPDHTKSRDVGRKPFAAGRPGEDEEIRATADRSTYDGKSQMLHLSGAPSVHDGALDLTAKQIDFARETGDAFAHGDVRATWNGTGDSARSLFGVALLTTGASGKQGAGSGPVHAVAADAELRRSTQQVVFRGRGLTGEPRLWQVSNSVTAPLIRLDRQKQTLDAEDEDGASPVRTVLLSGGSAMPPSQSDGLGAARITAPRNPPSLIRIRSGTLHYSEGERLAVFQGGKAVDVSAESMERDGKATILAQQVEVQLFPAGARATPVASQLLDKSSHAANPSAVDRMTARGHVAVRWLDQNGTGEKLVYRSEDSAFTLTGTNTSPPRITDQLRGTVTGSALIFHSADDSVTVEGEGSKTVTETRARK